MSRYFERAVPTSNSGYLSVAPGVAPAGGPLTFAVVFKLDPPDGDRDLAMAQTLASGTVWALNYSGGSLFWSMGGGFQNIGAIAANTWYLLVITKPAGSGQVRSHLCDMAADTWAHNNRGALGDSAGPIDHIWFGRAFGVFFGGFIAAAAVGAINLNDLAVEALRPGLQSWLAATLNPVWRFNDAPVTDLVGDADQLAVQGTTVNTAIEPPSFNYSLAAPPPPPPPPPVGGSFYQWLDVLRAGAQEYHQERDRERYRPVECPNDGEPLRSGPDGQVYCPYDGWRPPGVDPSTAE